MIPAWFRRLPGYARLRAARDRRAFRAFTPDDERRRREILASTVLPRWLQRCGPGCAELWNRTLAPATAVRASGP